MSKTIVDSRSMSGGIVLDLTKREFLRVLHVDDDPVFLRVAKQCLEIEGRFQVDTALSVEKAKEKMKKEMYDARAELAKHKVDLTRYPLFMGM